MESQTQLEYAAMDLFLLPFRVSWSGCWARSAALRSTFGLVAEQLGVDPEAAAPTPIGRVNVIRVGVAFPCRGLAGWTSRSGE